MVWQAIKFPIEMSWSEGEYLPPDIIFEKRDPYGSPMSVTITIESPTKIRFKVTNIKRVYVDFEGLMKFCNIPEHLVSQALRYVRDYVDHIDVVVSDSGTLEFEAKIPSDWVIIDVLLNGTPVSFTRTNNTIKVTVSLSEATITFKLQPTIIQQTYNIINLLLAIMVIMIISSFAVTTVNVFRRR